MIVGGVALPPCETFVGAVALHRQGRRLAQFPPQRAAGPLGREGNELQVPNAVVVRPCKIYSFPTGTSCSARMAVLSARGLMEQGDIYRARSIIGFEFVCRIAQPTTIGGPAIIPIVSGRAWITGVSQYMLDPADPWRSGYRLSDNWPRIGESI